MEFILRLPQPEADENGVPSSPGRPPPLHQPSHPPHEPLTLLPRRAQPPGRAHVGHHHPSPHLPVRGALAVLRDGGAPAPARDPSRPREPKPGSRGGPGEKPGVLPGSGRPPAIHLRGTHQSGKRDPQTK